MAFEKWKQSSILVKIATIALALAAVLTLIIGFSLVDMAGGLLGTLASLGYRLGFDVKKILTVFVLGAFAIDLVITAGIFFVKDWARDWLMGWGILNVVFIVTSLADPSPWFVPEALEAFATLLVFIAKKDFKREKPEADNQ